ncbi:MAG TPA: hypothetical protein VFF32_00485 [Dermatophilaceae bacterium]|nr:hypothetical protein [Dermatophilaceae bacterium]
MPDEGKPPVVLLRGVDRAAFATAFAVRLRQHGVPVGLTGVEDFACALDVSPPDSMSRLYWAARIALVRQRSELAMFNAVFEAVFVHAGFSIDPRTGQVQRESPTREDVLISVPRSAAEPAEGEGLPWATLPPRGVLIGGLR